MASGRMMKAVEQRREQADIGPQTAGDRRGEPLYINPRQPPPPANRGERQQHLQIMPARLPPPASAAQPVHEPTRRPTEGVSAHPSLARCQSGKRPPGLQQSQSGKHWDGVAQSQHSEGEGLGSTEPEPTFGQAAAVLSAHPSLARCQSGKRPPGLQRTQSGKHWDGLVQSQRSTEPEPNFGQGAAVPLELHVQRLDSKHRVRI